MTLGRRLATQLLLLLGCVAVTAGVGLWSVLGLRQDFSVAIRNIELYGRVYSIGIYLQSARDAMSSDFPSLTRAHLACRRAQQELSRLAPELPITSEHRRLLTESVDAVTARVAAGQPAKLDVPLSRLSEVLPILKQEVINAQQQADARKVQTLWLMGIVGGASIVASVVVGIFQWRAVMRPLGSISAAVKRVADAKFDAPVALRKADREFVSLASDVNHMAQQLESMYGQLNSRVEAATRNLVQSERLAGVGLLAAGVAHEINNPLAIITGRIELLLARPIDEPTRNSLQIALDEAFRCKQIIARLLTLSRGPSGKREPTRLDDLVDSVVANVRLLPGAGNRSITLVGTNAVVTNIDEGEIKQVLLNLLINAIHATDSQTGRIELGVRNIGTHGEVSIIDNGVGMDGATLGRLFEPFFSARTGEVKGTGLGLAISQAIIESHGGTIEAASDGEGKGSRFVVRLPAIREQVPDETTFAI